MYIESIVSRRMTYLQVYKMHTRGGQEGKCYPAMVISKVKGVKIEQKHALTTRYTEAQGGAPYIQSLPEHVEVLPAGTAAPSCVPDTQDTTFKHHPQPEAAEHAS